MPFHVDLAGRQPLANQIVGDCLRTLLGQLLVIGIGAETVGIADDGGRAILGSGFLNLGVEGIQCLAGFRLCSTALTRPR